VFGETRDCVRRHVDPLEVVEPCADGINGTMFVVEHSPADRAVGTSNPTCVHGRALARAFCEPNGRLNRYAGPEPSSA
jgi:hypothetical protein